MRLKTCSHACVMCVHMLHACGMFTCHVMCVYMLHVHMPYVHMLHDVSLDCRLADTTSKLEKSQQTARELGMKLEQVQLARSTAEADLAIEKQWRVTLQVGQRSMVTILLLFGDTLHRWNCRGRKTELLNLLMRPRNSRSLRRLSAWSCDSHMTSNEVM